MLGIQRPSAEKCADFDFGYMTARGSVRFMPDEYASRFRLAAQKPAISARAAIKLPSFDGHRTCPSRVVQYEIGTTVKPDEGFVDDDFIGETAREYVSYYGFNSELSVKAPHPSIQESNDIQV
jgi:hypothetical protein